MSARSRRPESSAPRHGLFQPSLDLRAGSRKTPSLLAVAEHWVGSPALPDYPGNIDMGEPFCAGCCWRTPLRPEDGEPETRLDAIWRFANRFLDRAHLVDHSLDGYDSADNLLPLCHICHHKMPSFGVGARGEALAWVRALPRRPWQFGLVTDSYAEEYPDALKALSGTKQGGSWLRRIWVVYLEWVAENPGVGSAFR